MALPFVPTDSLLRRRYLALLQGEPVIDDQGHLKETELDRWKELQRMVLVYGLPRDESKGNSQGGESQSSLNPEIHPNEHKEHASCSLRGRIWKTFLGVLPHTVDKEQYEALVQCGPSLNDSDIRNDTFRTFRGDPEFAKRVPEEKLVRLLNVFINELGPQSANAEKHGKHVRYIQGMNILCAPLLFVMPEPDAYHSFCQLILKHCPKYMAPQLKGVESGCTLVDKCIETLDPELYKHLTSKGITARIYALPLILSLFACVPPLHELLRVWDVLFAVGVHFIVLFSVAHTILMRERLLNSEGDLMKILSVRFAAPLESDLLISVALQLLHRLPDDLLHEIARHPFETPDDPSSVHYPSAIVSEIMERIRESKNKPTKPTAPVTNHQEKKQQVKEKKKETRPPWK